jgi:hypothetical protein
MRIKAFLAIVAILPVLQCSETGKSNDASATFREYLRSLGVITLPFHHNSWDSLPTVSQGFNRAAFQKYGHESAIAPLGVLVNDGNMVVLVDYSASDVGPVVYFTSFDTTGHKISELCPYQKTIDDGETAIIEYLTVNTDLSIIVQDCTRYVHGAQVKSRIAPGMRVEQPNTTLYHLSRSGKFTKVE